MDATPAAHKVMAHFMHENHNADNDNKTAQGERDINNILREINHLQAPYSWQSSLLQHYAQRYQLLIQYLDREVFA